MYVDATKSLCEDTRLRSQDTKNRRDIVWNEGSLRFEEWRGACCHDTCIRGWRGWSGGPRGLICGVNYEFPQYKVPMTGPRLCTPPLFSTFPPTFPSHPAVQLCTSWFQNQEMKNTMTTRISYKDITRCVQEQYLTHFWPWLFFNVQTVLSISMA